MYFDYPTCYNGLSIICYPLVRSEDVASWRILNITQDEDCANKYTFLFIGIIRKRKEYHSESNEAFNSKYEQLFLFKNKIAKKQLKR